MYIVSWRLSMGSFAPVLCGQPICAHQVCCSCCRCLKYLRTPNQLIYTHDMIDMVWCSVGWAVDRDKTGLSNKTFQKTSKKTLSKNQGSNKYTTYQYQTSIVKFISNDQMSESGPERRPLPSAAQTVSKPAPSCEAKHRTVQGPKTR